MPVGGGVLSPAHVLGLGLFLAVSGCVREAVLENELSRARHQAAALERTSDLNVAESALSSQLVELEALLTRFDHGPDARLFELLHYGYTLLAQGFIEARRLEALVAGDSAGAERERRLQADALVRAREYGRRADAVDVPAHEPRLESEFMASAQAACHRRDQTGYERELTALLARQAQSPAERLRLALAQRLAAAWLMPQLAARCQFAPAPG